MISSGAMSKRPFALSARQVLTCFSLAFATACGGAQTPNAPSSTAPSASPQDGGASLTAAACQAAGGSVVGDIGDGAIHKPGYRCPKSGEAPLGTITPEGNQPISVEGSVCCR